MFRDKELTYKVLAKQLPINDRKILDAAYNEEIKVMEPKIGIQDRSFSGHL